MINTENPPVKTLASSLCNIPSMKWNLFFILTGLGLAIGLFYYGISEVPYLLRVRGDAVVYMNIARNFTSFGEALHYFGTRSPGFPLFDYLFISLDTNSNVFSKANHICLGLFIIHELTSLWVCFSCVKYRLFTASSIYFGLLFLMLAAYPAMVMHTTTPLTDTFGMDLLLIGFSLFAWIPPRARRATHASAPVAHAPRPAVCPRDPEILLQTPDFHSSIDLPVSPEQDPICPQTQAIFAGLLSGGLLGYAIWVRQGYWIGIVGFLTVYLLMTGVNRLLTSRQNCRRSILMCTVAILTLSAVILPRMVMTHYKAQSHLLAKNVYSPDIMGSVKAGLTGARTLWNYPSGIKLSDPAYPVYPDAFLMKNFYDRCPVTSVSGRLSRENTNLLSCMYHAPHLAVVYFVKKMTGLFDTFRMTPFTEQSTPTWYLWLARGFSSIAFVGFWILLWDGAKGTWQLLVHRRPVSALMAAVWVFCIIQVLIQSILHVEERYALPWIPFCIIALFLKIKAVETNNYPPERRGMWFGFAVLIMLGYFIQVSVWDYGVSHHVIM